MNQAISAMLARYAPAGVEGYTRALREILQEVALLGLWRSRFFDSAAFDGGTALRVLYGLDRFSEDLDFSLLEPRPDFSIGRYLDSLQREVRSFGFEVEVTPEKDSASGAVQSAFLKADTLKELIGIEARPELLRQLPLGKKIKIKLEVDTDPPAGFATETRYVLQPVPFAVRVYETPDLFAGKMHALLFRKWSNRVKGRDWYDLVWFAANRPQLHLSHLEQRMRQSGHWEGTDSLTSGVLQALLRVAIEKLDVDRARREVEPFLQDPAQLELWSRGFFEEVASRVVFV
ncbi:MAG TPA: nucleotidyl transferase AbiEii/AbiGii toxin family protein [Thermoleophilia bacterium]|nr:nucleotidyl transferase AbiEii/AbiGii toxin family protein [Thermoleophilia bacterium]